MRKIVIETACFHSLNIRTSGHPNVVNLGNNGREMYEVGFSANAARQEVKSVRCRRRRPWMIYKASNSYL